jgi:hypothetical protein
MRASTVEEGRDVADWVPTIVVAAVGVVLLVVLTVAVLRHLRRFTRAQASLSAQMRTGISRLRALAYERGTREPTA